jgi:hypothetical protein
MTKAQLEHDIAMLNSKLTAWARENTTLKDSNDKLARENNRLWGLVDRLVEAISAGAKEAIWPRRPIP